MTGPGTESSPTEREARDRAAVWGSASAGKVPRAVCGQGGARMKKTSSVSMLL